MHISRNHFRGSKAKTKKPLEFRGYVWMGLWIFILWISEIQILKLNSVVIECGEQYYCIHVMPISIVNEIECMDGNRIKIEEKKNKDQPTTDKCNT